MAILENNQNFNNWTALSGYLKNMAVVHFLYSARKGWQGCVVWIFDGGDSVCVLGERWNGWGWEHKGQHF